MDEQVRNGYEQIRVRFEFDGDLAEEQKQQLVELAQQRSPVFDIVTNRAPVAVHVA